MIDEQTTPSGGGGMGGDWVSAAINLGSVIYNAHATKKAQERANQANREQADLAYNRDKEMWNMQNEYNSPIAQMQRLRDAGLNPNMVYGGGAGGASGSAGPGPKYNAPNIQPEFSPLNGIPQVIQSYQDFSLKQAQINNLKATNDNIETRTANEALRGPLLELAGQKGTAELRQYEHTAPYQAGILYNKARASTLELDKAKQALSLMSQQEIMGRLNQQYREKQISMQDIESEQKQAALLFQQYKNDWMRAGVTSSDHIGLRVITRMLNEVGIGSFGTGFSRARNEARKYIR